MLSLYSIFHALWVHDYVILLDPKLAVILYCLLFSILLLENGLLPAAFLPGDSLLFLTGVLIAKGGMHFTLTVIILTIGASLGSWFGFLQGRWLSDTRLIKGWMAHIPEQYHERSYHLFAKYGLLALFLGRFIGFVRTLLPLIAAISGLERKRFYLFNWLSALFWVLIIVTAGFCMAHTKLFALHEKRIMELLVTIPLGLLIIGLITSIWFVIRGRKAQKK